MQYAQEKLLKINYRGKSLRPHTAKIGYTFKILSKDKDLKIIQYLKVPFSYCFTCKTVKE